jgi:hypothetical protein
MTTNSLPFRIDPHANPEPGHMRWYRYSRHYRHLDPTGHGESGNPIRRKLLRVRGNRHKASS